MADKIIIVAQAGIAQELLVMVRKPLIFKRALVSLFVFASTDSDSLWK